MSNKQINSQLQMFASSRRHFLRASAIAGSLAAVTTFAPTTISGIALAEAAAQEGGDLGILNYALTLEHLENALYAALLKSGLLTGQALAYAKSFGAHENTHVEALTKTIKDLGGTPVAAQAAYNFPVLKTEAEVIKTLAMVEDLGASAYLGAAPLIQSPDLLTVAVQIHSNEAQHATAFRYLAGQDPVPEAFAKGMSMADVVKAVTPFLTVPAGGGTTPPPAGGGTPSTMPNTSGESDTLKILGVAGGIAAAAAGLALARKQQAEPTAE